MINSLARFVDENKTSIFSFLTVGLLTAIFYFSFFHLLWKVLNLNYHIALSIAYVVAITAYFFVNRHFTFKNKDRAVGQQFTKFLVMVCFNYVITIMVVHSAVEIFMLQPTVGAALAIVITTITNYFIAKIWIFKNSKVVVER